MRLPSGLLPSENLAEQRELADLIIGQSNPDILAVRLARLVNEYQDCRGWDFRKPTIADHFMWVQGE